MENVFWYEDVKVFVEVIVVERGGVEYELVCEYLYLCCVLFVKIFKFKVNGKWYIWIDYEKF